MRSPRNVTLELLRHGRAHNQLLSPLTQYLALCGNHSPVTVHVPYEHNQFLARHMALTYEGGSDASARERRELQLQITADEMSEILAGVPGMISELAEPCEEDEFTHFELVLSASELALLPFELANAPNGFPGAGQSLTLQSQSPLCLTRRARRVENADLPWPLKPRILFAAALPRRDEGLVQDHVTALRKALDPWVTESDLSKDEPSKRLDEHLTILPRASEKDISRALSGGAYTHVHVLAHGVRIKEGVDERFGLALYDERQQATTDKVSSSRLATMLRSFKDDGSDELSLPATVTVASCHGASQGSVVGAGSSIAHALHEAGIPLVVSSQFPLSFRGSTIMAEVLYNGLLWGNDPRVVLNDLRRQLKSRLPDTHDWASLVAYAAFPSNLDAQLSRVRLEQARRSVDAAFKYSDWAATSFFFDEDVSGDRVVDEAEKLTRLIATGKGKLESSIDELEKELEKIKKEPERHLDRSSAADHELATVYGRAASTEKRVAEAHFAWLYFKPDAPIEAWQATLRRSQFYYQKVFELNPSQSWALVQDVAISMVLGDFEKPLQDSTESLSPEEKWRLAWLMSKETLYDEDRITWSFALSNLIELSLVSLMLPENGKAPTKAQVESRYRRVRDEVFARGTELETIATGKGNWEIVSQRRQLNRYVNWFYLDDIELFDVGEYETFPDDVPRLIKGLAKQLLQTLPSPTPESVMRA